MNAMDKDCFGVSLTSKWTSVLEQRLFAVFIFYMKKKYIVIERIRIENEKNFLMNWKENVWIVLR